MRVYHEDTDSAGVVYYANYLRFMERARTEWLRSLGFGQHELRETSGGMFVVGETRVRYLQPARLDDELIVTAEVTESGRASLIIAQQALLASSGALLCEGTIRIGWVRTSTLQPARIPSPILEAFQKHPNT